jgi:hypothetical protein
MRKTDPGHSQKLDGGKITQVCKLNILMLFRNPRPLGLVRGIRLCLKKAFEIAIAKP